MHSLHWIKLKKELNVLTFLIALPAMREVTSHERLLFGYITELPAAREQGV